jgi:hypothetical protein
MNPNPSSMDSLKYRARELKRLGNSDAEIRAVLLRSGAQPNEVETILAEISPAKKRSGGNCLLFLAIGLVVVVIAAGVLAALYLFAPTAEKQTGAAESLIPNTVFNDFEIPTAEVIVKPPTAVVSLSPEAEAYFSVIWNLQGDPIDKAMQFAAAVPPLELLATHAGVATAFIDYGKADEDLKAMELSIELECAGVDSNYCKNLLWEKASLIIDRDKAHSDFYDLWLRACKPWQEYYEGVGAVFPYLPLQCKYP